MIRCEAVVIPPELLSIANILEQCPHVPNSPHSNTLGETAVYLDTVTLPSPDTAVPRTWSDTSSRIARICWTSDPTDPADPPPTPAGAKARILVIDDHPITRLGIRQIVAAEHDLEICGEADSGPAALAMLADASPQLAVVDLSLSESTGLELIRSLRASSPGLLILVLSMHDETLYAERVLRAGARGYIMKREAITGLIGSIRTVLAGRIYVSEAVTQAMLERLSREGAGSDNPLSKLTDRELEIFNLIGRGLTTAMIARQLGVSIKTIERTVRTSGRS
jgi:DNA-binding NarL/FixJ family response regulator